jgi:uncharacterized protein DUF5666/uncharacterized protein DUF4382
MRSGNRGALLAALFLTVLVLAALLNGCGSGSSTSGSPQRTTGLTTVLVTIGDAASDRIATFIVTVNSISLTDNAGNVVSVLSSPVTIEITHLTGTTQPIAALNISAGTYTKATISLGTATATVVDPVSGKESQQALPAPSAVTLTLNPSFVLSSSPLILNLDLSLAKSITLDASGNILFNPIFVESNGAIGGTPPSPLNGGLENDFGSVTGVTNTSFTMTVGSQSLTFSTNSGTQFVNFTSSPPQIAIGMLLMVDGKAQSDGSLLATRAEAVNPLSTLGALGLVRAVNHTTSQLQLLVRGAAGSSLTSTVGSGLLADFDGSTVFRVDNDGVDVSDLAFATTFNATTIAPGQFVEVDTATSPIAVTPPTNTLASTKITATKQIRLEQQPLIGTVTNFLNGVAVFTLTLPADSVFADSTSGTTAVTVFVQPGTSLLTSLSNGQMVIVRGLLFLDSGTYKMVAGRIVGAP